MSTMTFHMDINAPKQKVWEIMLADKTYREWTSVFQPGSYYEGSWDEGSRIRFLAMDDKGKLSGMSSKIIKNKPYGYLSIENIGEVVDGVEDVTSESARQWAGSHENYILHETNGVTHLTVELESEGVDEEMTAMFEKMWPVSLQKLKALVEAQGAGTGLEG